MTSETDAEFVERMDNDWVHDRIPNSDDAYRLFALARRGAAMQLVEQKLAQKDGKPCVEETYFRRMFLPPPPAGETNER